VTGYAVDALGVHDTFPASVTTVYVDGQGYGGNMTVIMQGALDDNMLPEFQTKFAEAYKAAGGDCQFQVFDGCEHEWVATPGPQTDRARAMVKAFIARLLTA